MKQLSIIGLSFIALPAILLGALILHFGVDVPFWDQWSVMGLSEAFHLHVLTFGQLFAQYNEDRLFFPRLMLLEINALANGNVKYQMFGTLLLVMLVMFNVFWLARQTMPRKSGWLLAALASLLIFSPIQYENWLWGSQFGNLIPIACLTTALAVAYSNRGPWFKLSAAAALSTVATFSYVNGTACWLFLLPVLWRLFETSRARVQAALTWIALAGLNFAAFFYHYRTLNTKPSPAALWAHAELVAGSFFAFFGAPLSFGMGMDPERVAHYVGAMIMLIAAIALWRFVEVWNRPDMVSRSMPWLTIGTFALATGVLVTIGRATSSLQRLLESRYTSFSVYFIVALIFLWPIVFEDAKLRPWVGRALVLLILILYVCTTRYALGQMEEMRTDRLEAKACLAFFDLIDDSCQTQRLDWDPVLLRQRVQSLERLGFFHPPLVRSPDLRRIAGDVDPSSKQYGVFESLTNVGSGFYRASGSAMLPQRGEPADAVVLSYLRADGEPVAFALADNPARWEKWFEIPPGADRIQAWAYDALSGRADLLAGDQRASNAPAKSVHFTARARGFLETVDAGDVTTVKGWAVLLNKQKPADMVLLTCGNDHSIIAAGRPWAIRPDVARELGDTRYLKSSWQIPVGKQKLPPGCELKAWAYDAAAHEAGLLPDLRVLAPKPR